MGMVPIIWTSTPSGSDFDTNGMMLIVTTARLADFFSKIGESVLVRSLVSNHMPLSRLSLPTLPHLILGELLLSVVDIILTIRNKLHRLGT